MTTTATHSNLTELSIGDSIKVGICDDYLSFNGQVGVIVGFDADGEPLVQFKSGRALYVAHRDFKKLSA